MAGVNMPEQKRDALGQVVELVKNGKSIYDSIKEGKPTDTSGTTSSSASAVLGASVQPSKSYDANTIDRRIKRTT